MSDLIVQYSSSTAFMSRLIRVACHSKYSHVDIVLPGEGLLGVSGEDPSINDPGGVRVRPFDPWPYEIKCQVTIQTGKADAIIAAAKSQIGKPFDDQGLHAFLSPWPSLDRDWRALDKWFCSEWFIWSCESEGLFPWQLVVPMNRINPNDSMVMINPFLSDVDANNLL